MNSVLEVAIVGAGPYGLSIAAHLQSRGVHFGIFGPAMEVWRQHMPQGMLLKSDGFASNLSDPNASFTLKQFCQSRGLPYDNTRLPVPIETFIDYGLAFQEKMVPHLDSRRVTKIERTARWVPPASWKMAQVSMRAALCWQSASVTLPMSRDCCRTCRRNC